MLWDLARAAHMDIALDIKSTACRLTSGPSEKRLIIERGIVFTGLSWAKMVKELQPSFAVRHEQAVNRDIKIRACGGSYLINTKSQILWTLPPPRVTDWRRSPWS